MTDRYCFSCKNILLTIGLFAGLLALGIIGAKTSHAYYNPPLNIPDGPPPNYFLVDSTYFLGEPTIPFPPPDDAGGFYVWVDTNYYWNIANHIYSPGNSFEQFHASVLARMSSPPALNVNVFATNIELYEDTTQNLCYKQNDRWGWYHWGEDLYEIWWDVSTREYQTSANDPNDFMKVCIAGCAIDFNLWSSGHGGPYSPDQVYLGSSMTRLSDVPDFEDTFPGIDDPYQQQAGEDPTGDPNITIFTQRSGTGESYNKYGLISSFQTYPCGQIDGQEYGERFTGSFVYEGNGIQFSAVSCPDPCETNSPPELQGPFAYNEFQCEPQEFCFDIDVFDPDDNFYRFEMLAGSGVLDTLTGVVCFTPVISINHYEFAIIAIDSCDAADTAVYTVDFIFNNPPIASCPWGARCDTTIFLCELTEICLTGFSCYDPDDNLASCVAVGGDLNGNEVCFMPQVGMNYIKLIATDECGVADTCIVDAYIILNSPPEANCPGDQSMSVCDLAPITISGFSCSDVDDNLVSCDVDNGTLIDGSVTFTPVAGVNTITLTATDACGETDVCQTTITVTLNSPPEATCPGDEQMLVCDLAPITIPGFSCSDVDDNLVSCDVDNGTLIDGSVTFTPIAGANTITLTATDACGETDVCQTTITVTLNSPPEATCPGNEQMLVCDLAPITIPGFSCSDVDDNLVSCDVDIGTLIDGSVTFTPIAGVNTITLTATDACGETDVCQTTITVTLNSPPVANCPGDQSMSICDLAPITISGFSCSDVDDNLVSCDVDNGTLTDGSVTFTPVAGVNTITLTATDACGETDVCQTTITVTLNSPPEATCPGDEQMLVCDLAPITISGFSCSDVDDNLVSCDVDNGTLTDGSVTFTPIAGVNTITLTATDACGETDVCQTTITVTLNSPPVATCPGDQSMSVCDLAPITIPGFSCSDVDDNLVSCDVDNGTLIDGSVTFTPVAGVNTIALTATDACGETDVCQTTITVTLNSPPEATCPGDQSMSVCDLAPITIPGFSCSDVDDNLVSCDVDNGTLTDESVTFTPIAGVNTITLTATDECGATDVCQTTITVTLNSPPEATCPGNQSMSVCDLAPITISGFSCSDVDDNLVSCDVDNGTLIDGSVTFTPVAGVNTITLTATDACGETDVCQTTITVTLNSPPEATCAGDQSMSVCDLAPITIPGFSCSDVDDNLVSCDVDNGTLTDGSVTFTPVAGANTITLTATDACGETDVCQTTITVTLNSPPEATCPGDQSMSVCDLAPITIPGFSCSDVDDNLVSCDVDNGTLTDGSVTFTPVAGTNVITLTATDACGETDVCQTTITVTLNSPPEATCPGDQLMSVCDLAPITIPGFSCSDVDDNLVSCDVDNGTLIDGSVTFTPVAGVNVITLTATDACGETDVCQTTITVTLNSPPIAECRNDTTILVDDLSEICLNGFNWSDPDDNIETIEVAGVIDGRINENDEVCFMPVEGQNTITLIVTDECGLSAECQTVVNIIANTCPVFIKPDDEIATMCIYENFCDTVEVIDEDGDYIEVTVNIGELTPIIDEAGHWLGIYCFTIPDSACGHQYNYQVVFEANDGSCFVGLTYIDDLTILGVIDMDIEDEVIVMPGETGQVGVFLNTYDCLCVGSINSSIGWDPSILTLLDITITENLDFGQEYHNINFDAFGPGTVKFSYIAELNNQIYHGPLCDIDPEEPIFIMEFEVTPGEYPIDFAVPICFIYPDSINQNAVSDSTGYHVWFGDGCSDAPDSSQFGTMLLNLECGYIRIMNECDLLRGDINMNRYPFEVGDVVLLANHLIDPEEYPFTLNQMWASDVNGDSIRASIADLIYMINVINGIPDNPKIIPLEHSPVEIIFADDGLDKTTLKLKSEFDIGGLLIDFPIPEGIECNFDISDDLDMSIAVTEKDESVRLCIFNLDGNVIRSGAAVLVNIDKTEGFELSASSISISDSWGNLVNSLVKHEIPLPEEFGIVNCYPNPFNAVILIEFALPEQDYIVLDIFDVTGRLVKELVSGELKAGYHGVRWNGDNSAGAPIASGIYFTRLKSLEENPGVSIRKLVLLK